MRVSRQFRQVPPQGSKQQGYILLMMMLFVTLMAIAATAAAPGIIFNIKRDREQEMIHRGVQYSRAIRNYVKKFGRYPTRLEDLENTNNIRFLRKRYKDPITGKDFKLLHMGDVQTTLAAGFAGAAGAAAGAARGVPGINANTVNVNTLGAIGAAGAFQQAQQAQQQPLQQQAQQGPDAQQPSQEDTNSANNPTQDQPGLSGFSNQTFGGGPIVGVASTSKENTIREYNKKKRYNQWQFIYDPTTDRGGLITTPYQPPIQLQQTNPNQSINAPGVSGNTTVQPANPGNTPAPSPQ